MSYINDVFKFITYNDSTNFMSVFDSLFDYINSDKNIILIFDEAHNLFNSIVNTTEKSMNIYNRLTTDKKI